MLSATFFIHFWDAFPHQVSSTRCSENSDGLVLRGTRFLSFTFFSLVHLRKEQECPRLEAWIASKDVLEPWDLWMLSWGSSKYLAHQQCTCSVGWLDAAQCVLPFPVVIHEDHPSPFMMLRTIRSVPCRVRYSLDFHGQKDTRKIYCCCIAFCVQARYAEVRLILMHCIDWLEGEHQNMMSLVWSL